MISPLDNTASIPRIRFLVIPNLRTLKPPAFVETIPPICADPLAPKFRGSIKFFSFTEEIASSKITPD